MRLLVVGASGQVGRAVARIASDRGHDVFGGFVSRPPSLAADHVIRLDKTNPASVVAAFASVRPEAVVDTGALHNVDYCEGHEAEAMAQNRDGTGRVAQASRAARARYLFVSTDFVFDGAGNPPYPEDAPARPLSVYGRSKLEGEAAARAAHPEATIVRPAVIYSWIPPAERRVSASQKSVNFGSWVIDQLRHGEELRIVEDQVTSPTLAADLAEAILALVERGEPGTFHAAGATAVSRFEFTRQLAVALGLPTERILPVTTASLKQVARRPANSSLDSSKLAATTGHRMAALPDALGRLAAAWRAAPS